MLSANGYETRLAPVAEHVFRADDATRVLFEPDGAGRIVALHVEQADGRSTRADRVPEGATAN